MPKSNNNLVLGVGVAAALAVVGLKLWKHPGGDVTVEGPGGLRVATTTPENRIKTGDITAQKDVTAAVTALPDSQSKIELGKIESKEGGVDLRIDDKRSRMSP